MDVDVEGAVRRGVRRARLRLLGVWLLIAVAAVLSAAGALAAHPDPVARPSGPAIDVPEEEGCGTVTPGEVLVCRVLVASTGSAPLRIESVQVDGPGWTLVEDCRGSVPAGDSCTVVVVYDPPTGARAQVGAVLRIEHNAGTGSSTIRLRAGEGTSPRSPREGTDTSTSRTTSTTTSGRAGPAIEVAPELDCGAVGIGESLVCAVPVASTGSAALRIEQVQIDGTDWSVIDDCAGSIPAGDDCTITVAFDVPEATPAGEVLGVVTIEHNAPGGTTTSTVRAEVLDVEDESFGLGALDAPEQVICEPTDDPPTTALCYVEIGSSGTAPVEVYGVAVEEDPAGEFNFESAAWTVDDDTCSTVFPGEQCVVTVIFVEQLDSPFGASATLTIFHDAPGGISAVRLETVPFDDDGDG